MHWIKYIGMIDIQEAINSLTKRRNIMNKMIQPKPNSRKLTEEDRKVIRELFYRINIQKNVDVYTITGIEVILGRYPNIFVELMDWSTHMGIDSEKKSESALIQKYGDEMRILLIDLNKMCLEAAKGEMSND